MINPNVVTVLNAVTATTTSGPIAGNAMGKVSIQLIAASIVSGNGVFTFQVSNDGSNWTTYNRMTTNVTNTNAQTDTRVASVTLSSNTTAVVTMPETDTFAFVRVICTVTTDGAYSAKAYAI